MGLIGGILGTLYGGFSTSLMSPLSFLRRPLLWLAARLRALGVRPGVPVGVCLNPSPEKLVALWGVLGGATVALGPAGLTGLTAYAPADGSVPLLLT